MNGNLKLGSLFDGSGGFPLAGAMCGISPVWASEIEPYPIAVTKTRFPTMEHLGDISKVSGDKITPVDIITFGSPCQDLSVAGKRAGLKHEANGDEETTRSGLFMEAVRIIKEMRCATNGKYPKFAIFENVPGAFSSNKGEDFRIVLEELIKIVEPRAVMPPVPQRGWPYADSYIGNGWSIAYRVFDAQYWGVPQRRRRIHLVADFRGESARKVLFEREGLRGYFAESRPTWKAVAADVERSIGTDDRARDIPYTLKIRSGVAVDSSGKAAGKGALIQENKAATLAATQDQYLFQPVAYGVQRQLSGVEVQEELAPTILAAAGERGNNKPLVAYSIGSYESNAMKSDNPHSGIYVADTSRTLDLNGGNPACNQGGLAIVEPIAVATQQGGAEITENGVCPTITAAAGMSGNNQPWICEPVTYDARGNGDGNTVNTITGDHNNRITDYTSIVCEPNAPVYCIDGDKLGKAERAGGSGMGVREGDMYTLTAKDRHAVAYPQQAYDKFIRDETGTTLKACGGSETLVCEQNRTRYIVRRLTPTECARLQGFADRWGDIEPKDTFTEDEYHFWLEVRKTHALINGKQIKEWTPAQMLTWYNKLQTDSAEYKMWGNGIALPPALYCMQGITEVLNENH